MPVAAPGVTVTATEPAWPQVIVAAVPDTVEDAATTVTSTLDSLAAWYASPE